MTVSLLAVSALSSPEGEAFRVTVAFVLGMAAKTVLDWIMYR